ncbi:DNA-3-methyladenine glycosylase [Desertivirga xinjiangensis]|uniref:DNA-3-methyladenine glycosylase n=1 Tax=Desertivirga xinjiangensis TaxID=539206 RepID=UPI00210D5C5B|nr:DNA-3-methyladenine glycosylase [Pedobacter xinjiangensis]
MKLPLSFYRRPDVVLIAKELLGKYIFSNIDGAFSGGIIVETEAYRGPDDLGSHAYNNRRTARNEMMYAAGGVVYMYICYGIHDMLNIVTGEPEESHAILVRAIEPVEGMEFMRERRKVFDDDKRLCKGPGALGKALGLGKQQNGISLAGDEVWLEDRGFIVSAESVVAAPRIGLNIAEPYKSIPWRFYIKGNKFISRK